MPNQGNETPAIKARTTAGIFARDGNRCVYCGATEFLSVDHLIPRSAGGDWRPDNLLTACRPCNTRRGNMPLAEYVGTERAAQLTEQAHLPIG